MPAVKNWVAVCGDRKRLEDGTEAIDRTGARGRAGDGKRMDKNRISKTTGNKEDVTLTVVFVIGM